MLPGYGFTVQDTDQIEMSLEGVIFQRLENVSMQLVILTFNKDIRTSKNQ